METTQYLTELRQDIVFETTLGGHAFTFHSTWGLFSPRQIDEGTRLLVEHLQIKPDDDCFDLGCGYGPIGLWMASQSPQGQTLMVDKDFIAVNYSNKNAQLNNLANASAQLGNGFDQTPASQHYNVIASNIPAKVGKEMLTLYLHDAHARLKPGGHFYVVTINGLRQFMKRYMQDIFGNYKKLKQGKNYTVACCERE